MALGLSSFDLDSRIAGAIGRAGGYAFQRNVNNATARINSINGLISSVEAGLANPTKYLEPYLQSIGSLLGRSSYANMLPSSSIARVDPVVNYMWTARIQGGSSSVFNPMTDVIDSIQTPSITYNVKPVFRNGKFHQYPSEFACDNLNLSMYTSIDGKAISYVQDWVRRVKNFHGHWGMPRDYKRDVILDIFDPQSRVVAQFVYTGCTPVSWNSYTFDSDAAQVVMTTLELSVDDIRFDLDELTASSITGANFSDPSETGSGPDVAQVSLP